MPQAGVCDGQANGEMRPGKKGISLVADQFEALVAAAPSLSAALGSQDLTFSAPISSKCVSMALCLHPHCAQALPLSQTALQRQRWHSTQAQQREAPAFRF